MELSSFVGRMSALKNELLSVLPKVTNAKTYLSSDLIVPTVIDRSHSRQVLSVTWLSTFHCSCSPVF